MFDSYFNVSPILGLNLKVIQSLPTVENLFPPVNINPEIHDSSKASHKILPADIVVSKTAS